MAPLAAVILVGLAVIATVAGLSQHAAASRKAEVLVAQVKLRLWEVDNAAWSANSDVQGDPVVALQRIRSGEQAIRQTLATLRRNSYVSALDRVPAALRANLKITGQIYEIGVTRGYGPWINGMGAPQNMTQAALFKLLDEANQQYAASADEAKALGLIGSSAAIVLLLAAFVVLYLRAAAARATAERLAEEHRVDALTDTLTGLRNRRALVEDLESATAAARDGDALVLALFDLDGFKQYNDTFGHAAGDALLVRLGRRLLEICEGCGTPYRMGGDEFCLVAHASKGCEQEIMTAATEALTEEGEQWKVTCSSGLVRIPAEANTASEALRVADIRMYAQKSGRASAGRQATDALLEVLNTQDPDTHLHAWRVALLARSIADALGLDHPTISEIGIAAELHDIGKAAIPETILSKPGPLDPDELALMRRHTLLGERIMQSAPALSNAASLVRHSHERVDGTGYPDGLAGDAIPLGSRIVGICDAFDAMISDRPYAPAVSESAALEELRRCAGTQFDARVVEVFCGLIESGRIAGSALGEPEAA